MTIKVLSQNLINQIAAGEVVERPSSVIKELMENSIDANSTEISVRIVNAGKSLISVSDDGCGMDKDSLELCVLSHATSKLTSENLFDIQTLGFRGEALPSISSISRVTISSSENQGDAWCLQLEGNKDISLTPTVKSHGTTVEVRDLFFATPARLKFLKSDLSETDNCRTIFNRIALSFNNIAFRFTEANQEKFYYKKTDNLKNRIRDIFGENFVKNIFEINAEKDGLKLHGYVGVPTFNKSSQNYQYFFVNNRFVKDKVFIGALRSAYSSLVPHGRHAVAVLFLDIPHNEVDVNAHPAKVEIRFKESEKVRIFIASELKKALSLFGTKCAIIELNSLENDKQNSTEITTKMASGFCSGNFGKSKNFNDGRRYGIDRLRQSIDKFNNTTDVEYCDSAANKKINEKQNFIENAIEEYKKDQQTQISLAKTIDEEKINLGQAVCQINNTYVIATTGSCLVIVDQHAAAERIMLEALKSNLKLESQNLLHPEVLTFSESEVELLKNNADLLLKFGICLEILSIDLVVVNALPALLETSDAKTIIMDIVDELSAFDDIHSIEEKIHCILSSISCHGSMRAGKKMTFEEMNYLLRKMENTPNVAQCCHGRPSYIIVFNKDLNKFFERS
jgi:DNA mismatch repair protein MutL